MYARTILVVGDKFAQFAQGKDAITLSQLRNLLKQDKLTPLKFARITLVPGQGLGDADTHTLLEEAQQSKIRQHFDFSLWYKRPKRAESNLSHKHSPENTLISIPKCVGEDRYHMHLMVDENCELMNDHQSGQHVQGMVLVEAARQSLLVVTEAFFLQKNDINYAFVFNKLSVDYNHFAFPFDADLIYTIREKNIRKKTRMSFVVDITIEQAGVVTASFEAEFSAFRNELISGKEQSLAEEGLITHLEHAAHQQDIDIPANG